MAGNRILYFYLLLTSFLLFVLFDLYLFHLFLLFVLLLPVFSLLAALPLRRAMRWRMEAEDDIVPKGRCPLLLTAENRSALPCACIRFHLTYQNALGRTDAAGITERAVVQFPLGPRRVFTLHPALQAANCGRLDFVVRRAEVCDMLRLFTIPLPTESGAGKAASVYVLPELQTRSIQTDDAADLGMDSACYSTEKPGGDPSEIFQLREYREGDAQHSIHWKLSGRMQRLIVREFGLPLNPSMHLLVELRAGATPEAADAMLGALLAFSEYLQARGTVHCMSWLGEDGALSTVSVTDTDALAGTLHALLALPGQKAWSALTRFAMQSAQQPDTHLVYLIAGMAEGDERSGDASRLLGSLLDLGVCRRVTLMPDRCAPKSVAALRALGCEVQLLDGSIPEADAEEAE